MNFSVHVTDIDLFRYYREDEDMTLADLLRQLRREEPPNAAMMAGTAFHSLLEQTPDDVGSFDVAHSGDYTFRFALDASLRITPIRELEGQRDIVFGDGDTTLTVLGRLDGLDGLRIVDHKLSGRFDPDRYHDSYQWRLYLWLFGAQEFTYNVFEAREDSRDPFDWTIFSLHPLTFWRYPELVADVERELELFAEFAATHLTVAADTAAERR